MIIKIVLKYLYADSKGHDFRFVSSSKARHYKLSLEDLVGVEKYSSIDRYYICKKCNTNLVLPLSIINNKIDITRYDCIIFDFDSFDEKEISYNDQISNCNQAIMKKACM